MEKKSEKKNTVRWERDYNYRLNEGRETYFYLLLHILVCDSLNRRTQAPCIWQTCAHYFCFLLLLLFLSSNATMHDPWCIYEWENCTFFNRNRVSIMVGRAVWPFQRTNDDPFDWQNQCHTKRLAQMDLHNFLSAIFASYICLLWTWVDILFFLYVFDCVCLVLGCGRHSATLLWERLCAQQHLRLNNWNDF